MRCLILSALATLYGCNKCPENATFDDTTNTSGGTLIQDTWQLHFKVVPKPPNAVHTEVSRKVDTAQLLLSIAS